MIKEKTCFSVSFGAGRTFFFNLEPVEQHWLLYKRCLPSLWGVPVVVVAFICRLIFLLYWRVETDEIGTGLEESAFFEG